MTTSTDAWQVCDRQQPSPPFQCLPLLRRLGNQELHFPASLGAQVLAGPPTPLRVGKLKGAGATQWLCLLPVESLGLIPEPSTVCEDARRQGLAGHTSHGVSMRGPWLCLSFCVQRFPDHRRGSHSPGGPLLKLSHFVECPGGSVIWKPLAAYREHRLKGRKLELCILEFTFWILIRRHFML